MTLRVLHYIFSYYWLIYMFVDASHGTEVKRDRSNSKMWKRILGLQGLLLPIFYHNYYFRYVSIGAKGRNSDDIFRNPLIYEKLESGLLPSSGFIVGDNIISFEDIFFETVFTQSSTIEAENVLLRIVKSTPSKFLDILKAYNVFCIRYRENSSHCVHRVQWTSNTLMQV